MNIFRGFCNFIWQNKRYILVFLFSMLVLVFFGFSRNTFDFIWNYGFSFAMTRGQVPYRDFTMIVPPLYNFVMAIGLKLFSTNNIVFLIEQSILITIIFNFFLTGVYKNIERFKWINNFQFYYTLNGSKDSFLEADKLYDKYLKKGNLIVLATNTSFLKIVNEDDFTYFTVLNKGNYGYNGTKKLIKKISKMNDYYCMIFMDDYYIVKKNKSFNYDKSQFDYEVVDYIMAQGEKVEESNGYFIYYIN